jgi:hypothetical protein
MMDVTRHANFLQQILGREADQLARETGLIQREQAFRGADFAQVLILGWLQQSDERVEGFVQLPGRREVAITASGLSQRFTPEAATFLQRLSEGNRQAEAMGPVMMELFRGETPSYPCRPRAWFRRADR